MTVIELIRALRKVENKGQEMYIITPDGWKMNLLQQYIKDESGNPLLNLNKYHVHNSY